MSDAHLRLAVSALAAFIALNVAGAQPKSVGTSFSFSGISLSYEHRISDECFAQFSLKSEMGEYLLDRAEKPGCSGSFTWNMILASKESRNGNRIDFFAGPGLTAGKSHDFKKPEGYFFGLTCRCGFECTFSRNMIVSASLAPTIGSHLEILSDSIRMTYFANGLFNGIMPEIGIRYCF